MCVLRSCCIYSSLYQYENSEESEASFSRLCSVRAYEAGCLSSSMQQQQLAACVALSAHVVLKAAPALPLPLTRCLSTSPSVARLLLELMTIAYLMLYGLYFSYHFTWAVINYFTICSTEFTRFQLYYYYFICRRIMSVSSRRMVHNYGVLLLDC